MLRRHHSATFLPVAALAAACGPSAALARECAGTRLPDAVELSGTTLRLNGTGIRDVSFAFISIDVYLAALYLERPARAASDVLDAPATTRLLLHFRRDVPRARLTDGFSEAFERAAPGDASLRERLERLNGWMQDMEEGGEVSFDYLPGEGIVVTVAGERRGRVPGADFARVFLGNWLGPHAVDPQLEAELLGASCV